MKLDDELKECIDMPCNSVGLKQLQGMTREARINRVAIPVSADKNDNKEKDNVKF